MMTIDYDNNTAANKRQGCNITTTTLVAVVHNNQIGGGVNLRRVSTDGDWIGQEIDHKQTHYKEEEEATTEEVCGVGGQGDERRTCINQPHWAGQDIEGGERRWQRDGMDGQTDGLCKLTEEIQSSLRWMTLARKVVPTICCSALRGVGVGPVLDSVA
jgi:hypothetical protein